jgi:Galactose oxidase, central domain
MRSPNRGRPPGGGPPVSTAPDGAGRAEKGRGPSYVPRSHGAVALYGRLGGTQSASGASWRPALRFGIFRFPCVLISIALAAILLVGSAVQVSNLGSGSSDPTSEIVHSTPPLATLHPGPEAPSSGSAFPAAPLQVEVPAATATHFSWSTARAPPIGNLSGAGLAPDPGLEEAVLFGGANSTDLMNETWIYSEPNNTWTAEPTPSGLTPRSDFGFAADPTSNVAVLFGGRANDTSQSVDSDTWVFNFTTHEWTNFTQSTAPAARQDPAFAVAPSLGEALLYGGWNRNLSGTGALIYSDAWILNLTTYAWTKAPVASGVEPPPLEGAGLSWDPTLGQFDLFGGCFPCTSTVWRYTPSTALWSEVAVSGSAPPSRGSPAWAYDPAQAEDVLFGGVGNGGPLNDTYLWNPESGNWTTQVLPNHPTGLTAAAATWMDVPTNETLLLTEGSSSTGVPALWRLAPLANLSVLVLNMTNGNPVTRATVSLDGADGGFTTALGYRNLTDVTPVEHTISAIAPGYSPLNQSLWLDPGLLTLVVMNLTPIPPAELSVQVFNDNGGPIFGANVSVVLNGLLFRTPILTNAQGFANYSGIPTFTVDVTAAAVYYHSSTVVVKLVQGKHTYIQIQLTPFPTAFITVMGYLPPLGFSWPLLGARVSVDPQSVGSTDVSGILFLPLDVDGTVQFSVSAQGFFPNAAGVQAPYTGVFPVNLTLTSLPFGQVNFHVLDADTHVAISGADVNVSTVSGLPLDGLILSARTGATGYSNESYPPTSFAVTVEHSGYITNYSISNLTVGPSSVQSVTVNLTPLPASPNPGHNGSFYLFPPGQPVAWVFLIIPLLLLLVGATYLAWMRGERPPPPPFLSTRRIAKPPPPPDPRMFPPPPPGT